MLEIGELTDTVTVVENAIVETASTQLARS
jgi:hypothetical protein